MNKKILWLVIVAFGLLGGIFFFPLPVGGSFTCLFHRWLMPWNSLPGAHPGEHMVLQLFLVGQSAHGNRRNLCLNQKNELE